MSGDILKYIIIILIIVLGVGFFIALKQMKEDRFEIMQALVGVAEAGDPGLDGHSLNVVKLSLLIYDALPVSYRFRVDREKLAYAALLLDVGKFGVPVEVRNKSGKLTDEEWRMIQRHPEIGKEIMDSLPALKGVGDWVLYHHERVDGSGYYKLKGDEIPVASRILAVADTYSAITGERSYRPSLSYEEAIAELKIASGKQLDEEIVKCFCDIPPKRIKECTDAVKVRMESLSYRKAKV